MPTKDRLKDIDLGLVRSILFSYVQKVNSSNVLWILPYIYELSIVLLCARAEMEYPVDKYCITRYSGWKLLLRARNVCSHNIYDTKSVRSALRALLKSPVLFEIMSHVILSDHNILQSRKSVYRGLANQDSRKLLH